MWRRKKDDFILLGQKSVEEKIDVDIGKLVVVIKTIYEL